MKKRILSFVLAVTMVAGMMLSALPVISAEETPAKPLKTWNVADELDASLAASQAKGLATPEFGDLALMPMAHLWNTPSFHHYVSASNTSSFVYGPNGSNDGWNWRNAVEVRNNRGVGEGKNQKGVTSFVDYNDTIHTYIFTAPVTGVYNFVPAALGGAADVKESIQTSYDEAFKYTVTVGADVKADKTVDEGYSDFEAVKGIELAVGDMISVSIASLKGGTGSTGPTISYNFSIQLMDEIVPKIPNPDVESLTINVAETLQSNNATLGAQTGKHGVTVWDAPQDTLEGKGIEAFTHMSNAVKSATAGITSYDNSYNGDTTYYLHANGNNGAITFGTKHWNAEHAIQFTPEFAGDWTISGTTSGNGFHLVDPDGKDTALSAGFFKATFSMEIGDKIWIYQCDKQDNWNNRSITLTDLTLFGVQTAVHHDAVYNIKSSINVAEELLKSTLTWDTAVQSGITFSGNPVFAQYYFATTSGAVDPQFLETTSGRVYGDYKWYSADGATGSDSNALYVWKDGSKMRYGVDGGGRLLGYKFTAPAADTYTFTIGAFDTDIDGGTAASCVAQFMDASGNVLLKNENPSLFETVYTKTMTEGEVIYGLVGRTYANWNQKRKFDFTAKIEVKELVTAAYDEVVDGWIDDPDYTYLYKRDFIEAGIKDADVSAKKEFTLDLDLTGFRVPYAGFALKVNYDADVLEVVKIEKGDALGANDFAVAPKTDLNPLILAYANNVNGLEDGTVAKITFKAKAGVKDADTTTVTTEVLNIARVDEDKENKPEEIKRYVTNAKATELTFFECEHANVSSVAATAEPTCTVPAHIAYYECDDCGRKFAEVTCDTFLTDADVILKAALGHDWEYDNAYNMSTGKWEHTATCNNGCGETIEATECTLGEWKASATAGKHEAACSVCKLKATEDCTSTHWTETVAPTWVAGKETATCDVCGRTDLEREIPAKTVASVTVTTNPTTMTYSKDATFDPAGMKVTVSYVGGGSTEVSDFTGVTFNFDSSAAGTKAVTFTFAGKSVSLNVTVTAGLLGDANGDGKIDTADATAVLKYIIHEGKVDSYNADCDGKAGIDTADATRILKYIIHEATFSEPQN